MPQRTVQLSPDSSQRNPAPELKASAGAVIGSIATAWPGERPSAAAPGNSGGVNTCTYRMFSSLQDDPARLAGCPRDLNAAEAAVEVEIGHPPAAATPRGRRCARFGRGLGCYGCGTRVSRSQPAHRGRTPRWTPARSHRRARRRRRVSRLASGECSWCGGRRR
jgi:hypothetical protein